MQIRNILYDHVADNTYEDSAIPVGKIIISGTVMLTIPSVD